LSDSPPCRTVDLAIQWARHYLRWVELASESYDLEEAGLQSVRDALQEDILTVAIIAVEGPNAWPAYLETLPESATIELLGFAKVVDEEGHGHWLESWLAN
jgi:hypothetical protein